MAGWLGLSPAPKEPDQGGPRTLRPAGGLVSREQLEAAAAAAQQQQPGPTIPTTPREAVQIIDMYPVGDKTFHSLRDFCYLNPREIGTSPKTLDLLFFQGHSLTSNITSITGWFTSMMGRRATSDFTHMGVAYVGSDLAIGLFEAVRENDGLLDVLTNRAATPGVRMVRLWDRIVRYARKGEHFRQLEDQTRVIKVGVMQFRMVGDASEDVIRQTHQTLYRRFEEYQNATAGAPYTEATKDLIQSQLPQIYGSNPVSNSSTGAMFCSKLACQTYQAVGALPRSFASTSETPSTLAAQTLPMYSYFRLGPQLYTIYVAVPRAEWDAEYQLAQLRWRTQQQQQQTPIMQQHHQQQYQQPLQYVAPQTPVPAAVAPPIALPVPTSTNQTLFLDTFEGTVEEGLATDDDYNASIETFLGYQGPSSEVFRGQGSLTTPTAHPVVAASQPSFLPPPISPNAAVPVSTPVAPPSQDIEDTTLSWMKEFGSTS